MTASPERPARDGSPTGKGIRPPRSPHEPSQERAEPALGRTRGFHDGGSPRLRHLAVTTGLAAALAVGTLAPTAAALAAAGTAPAAASQAAPAPLGVPGDGKPAKHAFGTVTSYDADSGVLVVATSAGGSVTATVTARTKVKLAPDVKRPVNGPTAKPEPTSPTASPTASVTGSAARAASKGKGKDKAAEKRRQRAERAAGLAGLVQGAQIRWLELDPKTGALRALVVGSAPAAAPAPTASPSSTPSVTPTSTPTA
jgi:hypothetical protein